MTKISQILVPVDVDRDTQSVLSYAALLAKGLGASVDLVHIFETSGYGGPILLELGPDGAPADPGSIEPWWTAQKMTVLLGRLREQGVPRVRGRMLHGVVAESIVDLVAKDGYDLVIMAGHIHKGLERFLLGHVTEDVVRECRCPVLAVPDASFHPAH